MNGVFTASWWKEPGPIVEQASLALEGLPPHWGPAQIVIGGEHRVDVEADPSVGHCKVAHGIDVRGSVRLWNDGQEHAAYGALGPDSMVRLVARAKASPLASGNGSLLRFEPPSGLGDKHRGEAFPPALAEPDMERVADRARQLVDKLAQSMVAAQTVLGSETVGWTAVVTRGAPARMEWYSNHALWARCETQHGPVVDGVRRTGTDHGQVAVELARRLATLTAPTIEAKPLSLAQMDLPVVMHPHVATQLMAALASLLSGSVAARIPALRGGIGRTLSATHFDLTDDPSHPDGWNHRGFDDEGTTARPIRLIRDGRLVEFLHTTETAAAFACPSNGRAFLAPESGRVRPSALNLAVAAGDASWPDDRIDITTRIEPFNPFRRFGRVHLIVAGWVVREGRYRHAFGPMDLDLPLLETLKRLRGVAADVMWCAPVGAASPSLIFDALLSR